MLREILEKLQKDESLCREAKALAKALMRGGVTLRHSGTGDEFDIDSDASIIGGQIFAKNQKGRGVAIDLCGSNDDYEIVK